MRTRHFAGTTLTCVALLALSVLTASAQDLRAGVEQLASQIAKGLPEGKQLRVAVADFPDLQGVTSDLGRYIASRLTTRLAQNPRFFVIERQRLGQVLAELKFSMSDLVDPTKAKQLGRMAGVEGILVGSIADVGNQVELDARLIEIETNRTVLGATVTISKDPTVTAMLERGRQEAPAVTPAPSVAQPGARPGATAAVPGPAKAPQGLSLGGFTFEPKGCRQQGSRFVCTVAFTNAGGEERQLFMRAGSKLVDDGGNEYSVYEAIGEHRVSYLSQKFVPQLPVNVHFITERPIPAAATRMTVIIDIHDFGATPVIRDIPIAK